MYKTAVVAALAALASLTSAIQIKSPGEDFETKDSGTVKVTWTSVVTDPDTFSIYAKSDGNPETSVLIRDKVQTKDNSIEVDASLFPKGDRIVLDFTRFNHPESIFAESKSFTVIEDPQKKSKDNDNKTSKDDDNKTSKSDNKTSKSDDSKTTDKTSNKEEPTETGSNDKKTSKGTATGSPTATTLTTKTTKATGKSTPTGKNNSTNNANKKSDAASVAKSSVATFLAMGFVGVAVTLF